MKFTNNGENENETLVLDQVPKPGVQLLSGATICLYSENSNIRNSVTVPNLKDLTLYAAISKLKEKNLNVSFDGARCSN